MAEPLLSPMAASQFAGLEEKLGFWQAAMSLAVSMLGTGIVAFPYAFNLCGYLAGPAALLSFGILAILSYVSLIKCTAKMQVASYGGLLQNVPRVWSHYTNVALWVLLILATTAYVIISAHVIRAFALKALQTTEDRAPIILDNSPLFAIILALIFPLSLSKSFQGLSAVTTYCSGAIVTVVVLIIWKALSIHATTKPPSDVAAIAGTDAKSVVLALPILGCAMFGHMNISQIYAELRPDVKPKANLMVFTAVAGCLALYLGVGAVGYATFGQGAEDDIVNQMAKGSGSSSVTLIIQALLASFVLLKAPLIILPLRSLTLSLIAPSASLDDLSRRSFVALTAMLLVCVYMAALVLPNLGITLQINGAVSVVPLGFVVPARLAWSLEVQRPVLSCILLAVVGALTSIGSMAALI